MNVFTTVGRIPEARSKVDIDRNYKELWVVKDKQMAITDREKVFTVDGMESLPTADLMFSTQEVLLTSRNTVYVNK